jgi:hypothetical protein
MRAKSSAGLSTIVRRVEGDQAIPGEWPRSSVGRSRERARERAVEGAEGTRVGVCRGQRLLRHLEHARAVEADLQQAEQRLRGRELVDERFELGRRQIEQAVAREELAFTREQRLAVDLGLPAELAQQRQRKLVRAGRRRRIDDDE